MVLIVEAKLQNENLDLIYLEQAETELINKYERCKKSTNSFLNLENMIGNVRKKYRNIERLPENEQPLAQSLMKKEIEKIIENFSKKKKGKQICW